MTKFKNSLYIEIAKSLSNNFGIDNFDQYRFGDYMGNDNVGENLKKKTKRLARSSFQKK